MRLLFWLHHHWNCFFVFKIKNLKTAIEKEIHTILFTIKKLVLHYCDAMYAVFICNPYMQMAMLRDYDTPFLPLPRWWTCRTTWWRPQSSQSRWSTPRGTLPLTYPARIYRRKGDWNIVVWFRIIYLYSTFVIFIKILLLSTTCIVLRFRIIYLYSNFVISLKYYYYQLVKI